jgi:hypothetical protein
MHLAAFQDAFVAALYHKGSSPLASQPGFQVYRNTVINGCIDALQANFPAVDRLVGNAWFRAAAHLHVRATPPSNPSLLRYGARFASFLQGFEPAADLPYLPGVATLDYAWLQAHSAADAVALEASSLSSLSVAHFSQLRLQPQPSARWFWFDGMPVYSIWDATRRQVAMPDPLPWRGEGALLLRHEQEVRWMPLPRAGVALLDALAQGAPLHAALDSPPGDGMQALLPALVRAGAFIDPGFPPGDAADEPDRT